MSKTWTFIGIVTPERVPITWATPVAGKLRSEMLGDLEFRLMIHASQVIVDLTIEKDDAKLDIATLKNLATSSSEMITNFIGYKEAACFTVEIKSAVCRETDDWFVAGNDIPILSKSREGAAREIDGGLLQAVARTPAAQFVLADFTNAMRSPIGTGFYCYRAIEAMMQFLKEKDDEADSVAWPKLRSALRLDRSVIDDVKAHADMPRHGKPVGMTDADRAAVFGTTDEIIRRFLTYLASGQEPLPEADFKILARAGAQSKNS